MSNIADAASWAIRLMPDFVAKPLVWALATSLAVTACHSAADRAERQAALADQLVESKALPAAAAALSRATALNSDDPDLWLKLGRVRLQLDDPGGADQAFQRAAELQPDSVEALENLVVLAVRGGQDARAKRYLDPLLVLQPDDPAGLLTQGVLALRDNRLADALAASGRLDAVAPGLAQGVILRARTLVALGRRADAIALLRRQAAAVTSGPDAIGARALLVDQFRAAHDIAGIRATALELYQLDPANPTYALEAARALHAAGQEAQVDRTLADLLRAHPGSAPIARAVISFRRDTLPPAQAQAAVTALAQGASGPVIVAAADSLVEMGAPNRALALLAPLAAKSPDAGIAAARAEAALGHVAAARARLDALLSYDDTNIAALVARARLRLAAGDTAGALTDAQLAQAGDGGNEAVAQLVAEIYAARGDKVLAQQAYAAAVNAFPDSLPLLFGYLDWLDRNGRSSDGLVPLLSFARAHPGQGAAWARLRGLCRAAGNPCLVEAEAHGRAPAGALQPATPVPSPP